MHHILQHKLQTLLIPLVMLLALAASTSCSPTSNNPLPVTLTPLSPSSLQHATNDPVLFIHGIANASADSIDTPTSNCDDDNSWGDAKKVLEGEAGLYPIFGKIFTWKPENLYTIGYYASDAKCRIQLSNPLPQGAPYTTGPADMNALNKCGITNVWTLDDDESIERLSCLIAWYIWDNFSNDDNGHTPQNVRVVAHSMGGLLIRYALAVTSGMLTPSSAFKNLEFPRQRLLVSDVVTFATPHGGFPAQLHNIQYYDPVLCNQCFESDEMRNDNNFMHSLETNANDPQGLGGTTWTMIGSDTGFEALNTSTWMQGKKVIYRCQNKTKTTPAIACYGHLDYLTDTQTGWDATVTLCTACQQDEMGSALTWNRQDNMSSGTTFRQMPHSLYYMIYGLLGIDPQSDPYHGKLPGTSIPTPTPTVATVTVGTTITTYTGHKGAINAVAWSPDGTQVASASDDGTVQVWDANTDQTILTYEGHSPQVVSAVAWSPDGKYIASGGADKTVQVWEAATGKTIYTYHGHTDTINAVSWSPDGKRIASGSNDQTIQIWDATTGGNVLTYQGHGGSEYSVVWSPDRKYIAATNGQLQVLDATTGTMIFDYKGLSGVETVAWSPDSTRVIAGGFGTNLEVVDIATQTSTLSLQDQAGLFIEHATAWSPDGKYIASGTGNDLVGGHITLWGAITVQAIVTYNMASTVQALAWSPDGTRIVSGSSDGTETVWEAE